MSAPHTPGPWRAGAVGGAVVADAPAAGALNGSDAIAYYGGHLICESVAAVNLPIIMAAPDMLAALRLASSVIDAERIIVIASYATPGGVITDPDALSALATYDRALSTIAAAIVTATGVAA